MVSRRSALGRLVSRSPTVRLDCRVVALNNPESAIAVLRQFRLGMNFVPGLITGMTFPISLRVGWLGVTFSVALLLCPATGQALEGAFHQITGPILIRNEHNSLLQLRIECQQPDSMLQSIEVALDNAKALESVQFYSTDEEGNLLPTKTFGERLPASETVIVRGHTRLKEGVNQFWLSGRLRPNANLTQKVDARVTAIRTSAGLTVPQDETPLVAKRIGIALRRHWDDGVHTYRIPALCSTPKGTLLCVYDMRRRARRDLQEDIDIGLLRSTDGGKTWSPQQVIMDMGTYGGFGQELNGCSDPGIIVDPSTGDVFCFAVWMHQKAGNHQWRKGGSEKGLEIGKSAQFMMVRSSDDGKTWTTPQNMTSRWKRPEWVLYAPSPQSGIALRDGTLVMPTDGRDEHDTRFSNLLISRDHGASWTVSSIGVWESTECQVVQLADGSIMLNGRTDRPIKYRTVAITHDLGQTWKPHETNRKGLIGPNCNGSLLRFDYLDEVRSRSVLLFANPHSQQRRNHHSIQVSFDEGRTWPPEYRLLLDEESGNGYPSLTQIDERHVGIVYEGSGADLVFEKISIDELVKP